MAHGHITSQQGTSIQAKGTWDKIPKDAVHDGQAIEPFKGSVVDHSYSCGVRS
jgi:hypothetical protein